MNVQISEKRFRPFRAKICLRINSFYVHQQIGNQLITDGGYGLRQQSRSVVEQVNGQGECYGSNIQISADHC